MTDLREQLRANAGRTVDERFFSKVHITSGCWEWTASSYQGGYGQFWSTDRKVSAHRFAYEQIVGPIPEGMELDHLCRNPRCVRPDHLEPVTHKENTLRGDTVPAKHAVATHCKRGHPFDQINTYMTPDGRRACRECFRIRHHQQREQRISGSGRGVICSGCERTFEGEHGVAVHRTRSGCGSKT